MFGSSKKNGKNAKTIEREEYFNNREYRRKMMNKKKRSSTRKLSVFAILLIIIAVGVVAYGAFFFQGRPRLQALKIPKPTLRLKFIQKTASLLTSSLLRTVQ